jgi:protein-disulfide isomerase
MVFSSPLWQGFPKKTLVLFSVLCLSFGLWSCTGDSEQAQADVQVDSELEAQILQVIRDNPQALIDSVQAYQRSQQEQQQQLADNFQQQMISDPQAVIGDSPTLGAEAATVVLMEFSDFECPFCARASDTLKAFMERHADTVTLVYKHLPLEPIHPEAIPAAEASWAAQQQGKFWEYHDQLFENQGQFNQELYERIAQDLGLDLEQFAADRERARPAITQDLELAQSLGFNGTPVFIFASTETEKIDVFTGALSLEEFEAKLSAITTP